MEIKEHTAKSNLINLGLLVWLNLGVSLLHNNSNYRVGLKN